MKPSLWAAVAVACFACTASPSEDAVSQKQQQWYVHTIPGGTGIGYSRAIATELSAHDTRLCYDPEDGRGKAKFFVADPVIGQCNREYGSHMLALAGGAKLAFKPSQQFPIYCLDYGSAAEMVDDLDSRTYASFRAREPSRAAGLANTWQAFTAACGEAEAALAAKWSRSLGNAQRSEARGGPTLGYPPVKLFLELFPLIDEAYQAVGLAGDGASIFALKGTKQGPCAKQAEHLAGALRALTCHFLSEAYESYRIVKITAQNGEEALAAKLQPEPGGLSVIVVLESLLKQQGMPACDATI